MPLVVPGSHAASNFENHISAKNNVSDVDSASDCEDTERRESDLLAPSSNKDPRRKKKNLEKSFKEDLEGYYMTFVWCRKMMNKYGGKTCVYCFFIDELYLKFLITLK